MEIIATAAFLVWSFAFCWLIHEQIQIRKSLQSLKSDYYRLLRARQNQAANKVSNYSTPAVDARARTTRRDTNDLPASGRMGKVVPRRKTDDSINING